MSDRMKRIRERLVDLGWNVEVLDAAIDEVRREGYDKGYEDGFKAPRRPRRPKKENP